MTFTYKLEQKGRDTRRPAHGPPSRPTYQRPESLPQSRRGAASSSFLSLRRTWLAMRGSSLGFRPDGATLTAVAYCAPNVPLHPLGP
jgi:hypothetical protein